MAIRFTPEIIVQKQRLLPASVPKVSDTVRQPAEVSDTVLQGGPATKIAVRLPLDLLARVDAVAKRLKVNRSQAIIAMLRDAP